MARMHKKLGAALVGLAALSLTLTACGGGGSDSGGGGGSDGDAIDTSTATGEVNYWLWDASQLPAYQACADAFHTANPNVKVKISQYAWDDYWSKLTNGFVAGDAPDVFTDHLSKYGEFVAQDQLVPLDATLAKDGFNTDQYQPGLADLWVGQDGKRYGLPKDFDTVAVFYNKKLTEAAGYSDADLQNLSWNPTDGGTYEKLIAHLTHGHQRQARRRGRLRQDQDQGLRPRPRRRLRRRQRRPDPVEHVHRLDGAGVAVHRQEPVGHALQLRPAPVPADDQLVQGPDRQGLHAQRRRGHRPGRDLDLHRRQVRHGDERVVEHQRARRQQGPERRPRADAGRSERQAGQHVQRPRRLDLGGLEEQAGRGQVGRVPRLAGLPEHRRRRSRSSSRPSRPPRTRPRPPSRPRASTSRPSPRR